MHLLWRRYARSGYAPVWFYALMAAGFVGLAVWAIIGRDWLIAGIAAAMVAVTIAGSRVMRRFSDAAAASERYAREDSGHDR